MENKCKEMSNKKRKQTKPSILGTEENRKKAVLQKFTRKQIVKKVLDTENQETTKDKEKRQIFKGGKW